VTTYHVIRSDGREVLRTAFTSKREAERAAKACYSPARPFTYKVVSRKEGFQLLREREMEKLEMELGRCLTPDERMAYQIGYNTGMEAGLEEAKRLVAEYGGAK
jgi:flagellar biosynthesis/type III secretory pathway protein FliH